VRRAALAIALLALPILAGCGSGATTGGPSSPGPAASSGVVGSGAPTAAASGSLEEVAAGLVPKVVPGGDLQAGASAGAYAIAIEGAAGRTTASGQAACSWDGDPPNAAFTTLAGDPTELMGEQVEVQISAGRTPELRRADGARYIPSGGSTTDPAKVGDVLVVRATQLSVDPADPIPVGEDKASYQGPLGGRADTARLDVAVAWLCEQPTASSSPTDAAAEPTPVCPPAVPGTPGPVPALVLASGTDQVDGVPFSSDYTTCTDDGSADGEWNVPDSALPVRAAAPLTISLDGTGSLFGVEAFYGPSGSNTPPADAIALTVRPGSTPDAVLVDPPPAGDWVLVVSAGIDDPDHGIVRNATYIYRIKVKG
jgi:hypothetical protein